MDPGFSNLPSYDEIREDIEQYVGVLLRPDGRIEEEDLSDAVHTILSEFTDVQYDYIWDQLSEKVSSSSKRMNRSPSLESLHDMLMLDIQRRLPELQQMREREVLSGAHVVLLEYTDTTLQIKHVEVAPEEQGRHDRLARMLRGL